MARYLAGEWGTPIAMFKQATLIVLVLDLVI